MRRVLDMTDGQPATDDDIADAVNAMLDADHQDQAVSAVDRLHAAGSPQTARRVFETLTTMVAS